jgi:hypothetical protein
MAERFNLPSTRRRELSVDEEAQSCAPQHRVIVLAGSKPFGEAQGNPEQVEGLDRWELSPLLHSMNR